MSGKNVENGRSNRGPAAADENRRALIAAAREILAERGLDAPYSAIASRAGVGQGTLYRHFPDKMTLAAAVFESNVDELEESASIEALFDAIVAQTQVAAAFLSAALPANGSPELMHLRERVVALVENLLARDQAAGRVDSSVEPEDVQVIILMLSRVPLALSEQEQTEAIRRARALFSRILDPQTHTRREP